MRQNCDGCSPDDDIRIANRVMLEGDLLHAAFHVAAALCQAPHHVEALALADELFALAPDPLDLVPITEKPYAGTMALRARFLEKLDRHNEAAELSARVATATTSVTFFKWALASLRLLGSGAELKPVR